MPTVACFSQAQFPPLLKWQALAFMRVEWPFIFQGDDTFAADTYPPAAHPMHFAAFEGDSLISYAATIRLALDHAGEHYQVGGLGNMFTFPPFRRQGYGRQVLTLATEYLLAGSGADVAILFCDPDLEPFYRAGGWETTAAPTYIGAADERHLLEASTMILSIFDHGRQGRSAFAAAPLVVDSAW